MSAKNDFSRVSAGQKKLGKLLLQQLDYFSGEMNAMQLIIDGADVNQRDAYGATALIKAAANRKTGPLRMILQKDLTTLHDTDCLGLNALSRAVLSGDRLAVDLLLQKGARLSLVQTVKICDTVKNDAKALQSALNLLQTVAVAQDAAARPAPTPKPPKK